MTPLISGSMIDHWRRCQRQYHYAHDRKIAPKETAWPLALGRAGHGVLASYYGQLQLGETHAAAVSEAVSMAGFRADVLGHDQKALGYVLPLIEYYWATHAEDWRKWEILGVEMEMRVERAGWTFIGTVDLLVREKDTAALAAVDHRFLTEFYTAAMARLDPQGPRYAIAARAAGWQVTRMIRNMVNTTPLSALAKVNKGRTKRVLLDLTQRRIEIVNAETERTAQQIVAWQTLPLESRAQLATRTVIPGARYPSCSTCPFLDLCTVESWGEDASELLAAKYGPTDYGNWEA